jgi:hypothetical protein
MAAGRPNQSLEAQKNIICYRESFDKENQEEEGTTGPRLYTTTFLPRIRSRSNKVPPTPVFWTRIKHGSGSDLLDQNLHIFLQNGPVRLWLPTYFLSVANPDLFKETKILYHRRVNV